MNTRALKKIASGQDPNFHYVNDLATHFGLDTHRDFEGLVSRDVVIKACMNADEDDYVWDLVCAEGTPELVAAVRDITLNIMHEQMEQVDTVPPWAEVFQIAFTVHAMLTCNAWLKVETFDPPSTEEP